jgi:hypothetical protein
MDQQVFMKQPEGFVQPGQEEHVCELLKALYGLKQAGMVWNRRFNDFLTKKAGFRQICADPCIYIRKQGQSVVMMGIHVDDSILVHNDPKLCETVVKQLSAEFEIKDLGEPRLLLGMCVHRTSPTGPISLDQHLYVEELLKRLNMSQCKSSSTPHQAGVYLTEDMSPKDDDEKQTMQDVPYGQLVGALLWLATNTRPDILPAVSVLCRFNKNPGQRHWSAAQLVLRYLKGTASFGIEYSPNTSQPHLTPCVDSDFANDPDTRRSVTGYVIMYANGPVAVKSKRQSSVATSSVQAEYQAACDAVREVVWLRKLLEELGHKIDDPTEIYEDNQGCISLTENNRTDPRTKHIDTKYHYTREQVANRVVQFKYVPTANMIADSLTKPISTSKFIWCRDHMGIKDVLRTNDNGIGSRGCVEAAYEANRIYEAVP